VDCEWREKVSTFSLFVLSRNYIRNIKTESKPMNFPAWDREYAAKAQYDFCNFPEVATTYCDTANARIVRGKCDRHIDYHAEKK
jgi:hypothetical protein